VGCIVEDNLCWCWICRCGPSTLYIGTADMSHFKNQGGGVEIVQERREHVSTHVLCIYTATPVTPAGEQQQINKWKSLISRPSGNETNFAAPQSCVSINGVLVNSCSSQYLLFCTMLTRCPLKISRLLRIAWNCFIKSSIWAWTPSHILILWQVILHVLEVTLELDTNTRVQDKNLMSTMAQLQFLVPTTAIKFDVRA